MDITWEKRKLVHATIRPSRAGICRVRAAEPVTVTGGVGTPASLRKRAGGGVEFETNPSWEYYVTPAAAH